MQKRSWGICSRNSPRLPIKRELFDAALVALVGLSDSFLVSGRAELLWRFLFRAQYQRDGFASRERKMKYAGLVDIFHVGQAAFPVAAMQDVPVPPACS